MAHIAFPTGNILYFIHGGFRAPAKFPRLCVASKVWIYTWGPAQSDLSETTHLARPSSVVFCWSPCGPHIPEAA